MTAFPQLFSPIRIGSLELRNRLVMSAMETSYGDKSGTPSAQTIAYFEARAKGGVGLITLGACTIDARHREVPRTLDFARDEAIAAHRELTDRIHAHGAHVQPQLVHPGPDGLAPYLSGVSNVGPSIIPSYLTGVPCRELELNEIPAIIDQYRDAAVRVREAGYDGIELHAAHGYMLLGSFLTPMRNRRSDAYSGDTQSGRILLISQVIEAIKNAVGHDFPLTLRISGDEGEAKGRDLNDSLAIAPKLVSAGVDAFHVSGGVIDPLTSQMVAGSRVAAGHNVAAAAALKKVVDVPVMAVGRIHDPALAEEILREQRADLVVMGRPLLADADFANKAKAGRLGDLRRCISCQSCVDSLEKGRLSCAINPSTGREESFGVAASGARNSRRIVIIGGGPAGMEAARLAAQRGHRVSLYERESTLGGALRTASTVHTDNRSFLDYLRRQVAQLPIELHLGCEALPEQMVELKPDVLIVATGGQIVTPVLPGSELPHVLTGPLLRELVAGRIPASAASKLSRWQRAGLRSLGAWPGFSEPGLLSMLSRLWMPIGKSVVIVGTDLAAVELAEFLAERGRRVSLVGGSDLLAPEVGPKRRAEHATRLDQLGIKLDTASSAAEITSTGVVLQDGKLIAGSTVIVAGEVRPDTRLFDALKSRVPEAHAIGDCTGLGLIRKATEEAARVATSL
ncbi:MAG TPA: FAD-dependent oxidoreductase [Myxococcales bacterium]|nr:FAD-dependent oxidoreductase [Myxococcales bacterium]HIL81061.1 FAD-dependent oxidoreductase [Myxococcales bacterium]